MRTGLSLLMPLTVFAVACTTSPDGTLDRNSIRAQIPIGDFNGYDPYPAGAAGTINAYVNFAQDGLLRVSLGCAKIGAPFEISDADKLILLSEEGLSKPDYAASDCSADLIAREKSLASFLEKQPKISPWTPDGIYLKSGRQTLLLQSVADVLDEDTKMKVDF